MQKDSENAARLGIEAAEEAVRAAGTSPTDVEGRSMLPSEYPAGWDLPDDVETDEEIEVFERAFERAMTSSVWEVRPLGRTAWAEGLSALEACRQKGKALKAGGLGEITIRYTG